MIVRLDQKTNHAKCEIYVNFNNTLHESIMNVLNFDGTSRVLLNPCHIITFAMHKFAMHTDITFAMHTDISTHRLQDSTSNIQGAAWFSSSIYFQAHKATSYRSQYQTNGYKQTSSTSNESSYFW